MLDAFSPVDLAWHDRLTKLDIAVDEVPKIHAHDPESVTWPPEVIADGPVPLSRLIPAGIDRHGNTTRARIVLFRRPLEQRAKDPEELTDLVHDVLVHQVGTYLASTHRSSTPRCPTRTDTARRGLTHCQTKKLMSHEEVNPHEEQNSRCLTCNSPVAGQTFEDRPSAPTLTEPIQQQIR